MPNCTALKKILRLEARSDNLMRVGNCAGEHFGQSGRHDDLWRRELGVAVTPRAGVVGTQTTLERLVARKVDSDVHQAQQLRGEAMIQRDGTLLADDGAHCMPSALIHFWHSLHGRYRRGCRRNEVCCLSSADVRGEAVQLRRVVSWAERGERTV